MLNKNRYVDEIIRKHDGTRVLYLATMRGKWEHTIIFSPANKKGLRKGQVIIMLEMILKIEVDQLVVLTVNDVGVVHNKFDEYVGSSNVLGAQ